MHVGVCVTVVKGLKTSENTLRLVVVAIVIVYKNNRAWIFTTQYGQDNL